MTTGFHVEVMTPERRLYNAEAVSVILPGALGSFGVLRGHIPLISLLEPGRVDITAAGDLSHVFIAVSGGFAQVDRETVRVLADEAEAVNPVESDGPPAAT
jgi:F-type H+-transporting ATPase subunit epsilon